MGEIGNIAEVTNKVIKNRLPSEQYQSTVGVYGGEITKTPDGKMVYTINQGFINKVDVIGDKVLRKFDDHAMKKPWKMLATHPKDFIYTAFKSEPMRHRGTKEEITANIQRLGLSEYYGLSERGIEIKKPEVFTKGIAIKDIFRADQINSPILNDIDRFQALAEETKYIRSVHDKYGPAVDFIDDVMFQKKEGNVVMNPVLNIPDVILTPSENRNAKPETIAKEQKATDVVELLTWTAFEEFRRSNDSLSVGKAMTTIIENYNDPVILSIARSFIKRGRPTLPGEKMDKGITALHNKVHLGANKKKSLEVRKIITEKLNSYFSKQS